MTCSVDVSLSREDAILIQQVLSNPVRSSGYALSNVEVGDSQSPIAALKP